MCNERELTAQEKEQVLRRAQVKYRNKPSVTPIDSVNNSAHTSTHSTVNNTAQDTDNG